MESFATVAATVLAVLDVVLFAWGGWRWWTVRADRRFWPVLRGAQALAGLYAIAAGVLYLAGMDPDSNLFWLYAVLPIPISFVAEQLRALSAQTVLDARGIEDAKAVGKLGDAEQQSIVRAILRREIGIMALSALAVAFLALRAAGTA